MKMGDVKRRLAAIVSGDIVDFSRLMSEDEEATVSALTELRAAIRRRVEQQRGRIVDFRGDDFLAEFASAVDAVSCAAELQAELGRRNTPIPVDRRMAIRLGIHLGDVRVEGQQILGDGVNIAARLEGLAETGGICISRAVHEQVRGKLELDFEPIGGQSLKNIPEPVEVFRVRAGGAANSETKTLTVPGFGGRPTIAVLPFDNMSDDPEQGYLADGLCEDLITLLSAWREVPVVSRNSSFAFRGIGGDVKRVSQALGARYVVEGSVRRAGQRLRITAQLIDATTGHQVWASRYDQELANIFQIQDEICAQIFAALCPELLVSERGRVARKRPEHLDAWEWGMRGQSLEMDFTSEGNRNARAAFAKAIEIDPLMPSGYFGLALGYYLALLNQWSADPAATLRDLQQAASRCVEVDPNSSLAQIASGFAHAMNGQVSQAIAAFERAVVLNPSSTLALAQLGSFILMHDRADEAVALLERARGLSPRDPMLWFFEVYLGIAHFAAGRYEIALPFLETGARLKPDFDHTHRVMAASLGHLRRIEEGREAQAVAQRLSPGFTIEAWRATFGASVSRAFGDRLAEGLEKLGAGPGR